MTKIDFTKQLRQLYRPSSRDVEIVDVPPLSYLMADGHGDPNTATAYAQAVAALYALSYTIKFISKRELDRDYVVPPLEGLWWAEDLSTFTWARDKSAWDWTMLILLPDWITPEVVERARTELSKKKDLPALPSVRAERYHEGLCAQILHIGPYDDEGPTLARLHSQWLPAHGYAERGKHHEIYLSDPRRAEPAKLKTILRQPVEPSVDPQRIR